MASETKGEIATATDAKAGDPHHLCLASIQLARTRSTTPIRLRAGVR